MDNVESEKKNNNKLSVVFLPYFGKIPKVQIIPKVTEQMCTCHHVYQDTGS